MKLETKDGFIEYTPVHERLLELKKSGVKHSITTSYQYLESEKRFVVCAKLVVRTFTSMGWDESVFTGHGSEVVGDSEVNTTAALENAETSAVGRALGMYGIGIEKSIASKEEMQQKTTSEETILAQLSDHLKTLNTEEELNHAAEQFQKKYKTLWSKTSVQKAFKKRKGEIIIKKGEQQ